MVELFKINNVPVVYREHLVKENIQILEDIIKILNNKHKEKLDKNKISKLIAIESVRFSKLNNWIFTVIDNKALNKINKIKEKENKTEAEKFLLNSYSYLDYLRLLSVKEKIDPDDIINLHKTYNNKKAKFRTFGKSGINILCDYKYNVKTDLSIKKNLIRYIKEINEVNFSNELMYSIIYSWIIMYIQPFKENNIVLAYSNLWALLNKKLNKSVVMIFKSINENSFTIYNEIDSCEKLDKNYKIKSIDITNYVNTIIYVIIEALSDYNKAFEKDMITSMNRDDFLTRVRLSDNISYNEMIYGILSGVLSKSLYGLEIKSENKNAQGIMIEYTTKK